MAELVIHSGIKLNGTLGSSTSEPLLARTASTGIVTLQSGSTDFWKTIGTTTLTGIVNVIGNGTNNITIAGSATSSIHSHLLVEPTAVRVLYTNNGNISNGFQTGNSFNVMGYSHSNDLGSARRIRMTDTEFNILDAIDSRGLVNQDDYSANYTDRTIPDWGNVWRKFGTTTLSGANIIIGTTVNTIKYQFNTLGTVQTNGAGQWLANTTVAAAGAQQISPSIVLEGQGWKTDATAASQSVKFSTDVLPVQGAANPSATWRLRNSINGVGYLDTLSITSGGNFTIGGGLSGSSRSIIASGSSTSVNLILGVTESAVPLDVITLKMPGGAPQILFTQTAATSLISTTNISGSNGGALQITTPTAIGTNISSGGITIQTGAATGTGTSGNLNLYSSGKIDISIINNARVYLDSSVITYGAVGIGTNIPETPLHVKGITSNLSSVGDIFRITSDPANTPSVGAGAGMSFQTRTGVSTLKVGSTIESVSTNITPASEAFDLSFKTMSGGTDATQKLRITSDGRLFGSALHNNIGAITGTVNQYIASGTYSPSVGAVSNVDTSTPFTLQYMRVGNVVTVSGKIIVDPTANATVTEVNFNLPVPSNFTDANQASGSALSTGGSTRGYIYSNATTDSANLVFTSTGTVNDTFYLIFTYLIL